MSGTISVIIPAYNAEAYIEKAVGSILRQTAPASEIVIASDDGRDYLAILADRAIRDPRVRCVFTGGKGTGVASARNTALRAATGQIIVSLDSDDLLTPEALAVLGPLARAHGAAYSNHHVVDFASGAELPNYNRELPEGKLRLPDVLTSNLHTYSCIAFDRRSPIAGGGAPDGFAGGAGVLPRGIDRQRLADLYWPAEIVRWEDVLFFAACADVLGALYYTPQRLYVYHRRQSSICNRAEAGEEFKRWAVWISHSLGTHPYLRYRDPAIVDAIRAYFRGQVALQTQFHDQLAAGEQIEYQRLLRDNLQLLAPANV
jgi:glycosyltransferase involved in cell wall biosynthesis